MVLLRPLLVALGITIIAAFATAPAQQENPDARGDGDPFEAAFANSGSFRGLGNVTITCRAYSIIADVGKDTSPLEIALDLQDARVRLVNYPYRLTITDFPPNRVQNPETAETLMERTGTGRITLRQMLENGTYRFYPLNLQDTFALHVASIAGVNVAPSGQPSVSSRDEPFGDPSDAVSGRFDPVLVGRQVRFPNATQLPLNGTLLAFLYGGVFDLVDEEGRRSEVWTGKRLNSTSSVTVPGQGSGTWRYDRLMLVVEANRTQFAIADPAGRTRIEAKTLSAEIDGGAQAAGVNGNVTFGPTQRPTKGTLLEVTGRFRAQGEFSPDSARWRFSGSATKMTLDDVSLLPVPSLEEALSPLPVVAGLGLLGLLVVAVSSAGQRFLGFVVGRNEATPLSNPVRVALLLEIASKPGIGVRELSKALPGMSGRFARYHVEVLKGGGWIEARKFGPRTGLMLNGASFRLPLKTQTVPGRGGPVPSFAEAMAVLNHPLRRRIFEILGARGSATYQQLVAAWEPASDGPPSQSLATYHLRIMANQGLLARDLRNREVVWRVAFDADAAHEAQRTRFASSTQIRPIVDHLRKRGPSSAANLEAEARQGTLRVKAASVGPLLELMKAAGLVAQDPQSGAYAVIGPAPGSAAGP